MIRKIEIARQYGFTSVIGFRKYLGRNIRLMSALKGVEGNAFFQNPRSKTISEKEAAIIEEFLKSKEKSKPK